MLAGRTRLAFASRTPGRTQQINLFSLRGGALVADLPGYGYAAVGKELKRAWQEFLWHYITTRSTLVALVLVVDARHGLKDLDLELLEGFVPSGRPILLLATKADKLNTTAQRAAVAAIRSQLAEAFPLGAGNVTVQPFSGYGAYRHRRSRGGNRGLDLGARQEKAPRSRGVTRGRETPADKRPWRGHPLREGSGRRFRLQILTFNVCQSSGMVVVTNCVPLRGIWHAKA